MATIGPMGCRIQLDSGPMRNKEELFGFAWTTLAVKILEIVEGWRGGGRLNSISIEIKPTH